MSLLIVLLVLAIIFGLVLMIGRVGVGIFCRLIRLCRQGSKPFSLVGAQLGGSHELTPRVAVSFI
jgi:hypothetical protein